MRFLAGIICICAIWMVSGLYSPATTAPARYASIVVDADTQEILHASRIDDERFPASLTKMMTLYMTFQALENGEISLNDQLVVSSQASRQPPTRLGLKTGETISVDKAIQALSIKSANDVAVVLAERIGGGEKKFAARMTLTARALGMNNTTFKNASGLPDEEQVTTARDIAKLAEALRRDFPQYYRYFSQESFVWRGRTLRNHNTLLGRVDGVDGLKTGFTVASGYNLAISAERDGRRIIAVVMGGASGTIRDKHMEDLIDRAYEVLEQQDELTGGPIMIAKAAPRPDPNLTRADSAQVPTIMGLRGTAARSSGPIAQGSAGPDLPPALPEGAWSIQVGAFGTKAEARARLESVIRTGSPVPPETAIIVPYKARDRVLYRARFEGLEQQQALQACYQLGGSARGCFVVAPNQGSH